MSEGKPPAPKQFRARLTRINLDPSQDPQLAWLQKMHELSGFHTPALDAIVICADAGIPFPRWLAEFVAAGVRRHLRSRDSSLDMSIGLKRRAGRPPDDKAFGVWRKRFDLVQHVHELSKAHGLRKACEILAGPSDRSFGMTAESLERTYKRYRRTLLMA